MAELLTLEEAALRLRCPIETLRRLVGKRRVPFLKLGGRVRIDAGELESFLKIARHVTAEEAAQPRKAVA